MSTLSKPTKRGYGHCHACRLEYPTRHKPKFCDCGQHLGGSYEKDQKRAKKGSGYNAVKIYETMDEPKQTIYSAQTSDRDTRQFVIDCVDPTHRLCYQVKCKRLRATYVISGKMEDFSCDHLRAPKIEPLYCSSFSDEDIKNFTPDVDIQTCMKRIQEEGWPTVVKVSEKSFAVKGEVSASNPIGYAHVMCLNTGEKQTLKCMSTSCSKKQGQTKQVIDNFLFRIVFNHDNNLTQVTQQICPLSYLNHIAINFQRPALFANLP